MGFVRKILKHRFGWVLVLLAMVFINVLASSFHQRMDLTSEKRFTLSPSTREILQNLEEEVQINVMLKGDYPAGFRKLVNSIEEFLNDCRDISKGKLRVSYSDPLSGLDDTTARYTIDSIQYFFDINPFTLEAPSKVGDELRQKLVLPGAIMSYGDTTVGVNFLAGMRAYGTEAEQLAQLYNDVEATLEYKIASKLEKLTSPRKPLIGYALGHGEAWGYNVNDAVTTLIKEYYFDTVNIAIEPLIPSEVDVLVILKPTQRFTEDDKFKIDQYIMNGGKVFWMIDNMYAEFDSLYKTGGFTAFDRGLNLEDQLFRYGARINQNLLQDMQSDKLPQLSGDQQSGMQQRLVDWPFFPVLNGTNHPISKNLDGVRAMFPNTLDTIRSPGIKKTFLLKSSANARVLPAPAIIDFEFMNIAPDVNEFRTSDTAVAVLLEGRFSSAFRNRVTSTQQQQLAALGQSFVAEAKEPTQMIVVADGDIAMNQFSQMSGPLSMGENLFTRYVFANKSFFLNSIEYLINPDGVLETRAKSYTLRLLDPRKTEAKRSTWQLINLALPVALVLISGGIFQYMRRRKYGSRE